jgi:threonine dehydrogenase-like Zn-dependent dehydrogenase
VSGDRGGAGRVLRPQAARLQGASQVQILDLDPGRLELIGRMGFDPINLTERHAHSAVCGATDDRGATW